ncbi:MAG: hypothetical protein IKL11_02795 [Muribaculaceae bacterium]|nr:hypothetical protein [Muribaculaceae bacterium]
MKKVFISMLCMASLVIMTACGGENNAKKEASDILEDAQEMVQESEVVSSEWPENEFTNLIPKPDNITITGNKPIDNMYYIGHTIVVKDWSREDCKAYIEKLKAAGFTKPIAGMKDVITNDKETIYSFDALNADGVHASVGIMGSNGTIDITKNKNQE